MTIVVAARDAAATIERAITSCLAETACPILLVDDHCRDDTVARAEALAPRRIRTVRAPDPGGVAMARQAGLDAVETEFAAWLDADDEWIAGRAGRLERMLRSGCDIATEESDLHDGVSGTWLRRLTIPAFLRRPGAAVRLFERNFLPGDTPVAFRTQVFRAVGYDAAIHGPESYDLTLRAIRAGARLSFGDEAGYRIYAYPGSVSRHVARQRAAVAASLRKHEYEAVRDLYRRAGYGERIAAWGLVSMALFRCEPAAALTLLDDASPPDADPAEILEPDGPWPFPEGWRRAFARGTILLLLDDAGPAVEELRRAEDLEPTPEGANNLGVALWRAGDPDAARHCFGLACARWPGYADARDNLTAREPNRITTHPMRRTASRSDYD